MDIRLQKLLVILVFAGLADLATPYVLGATPGEPGAGASKSPSLVGKTVCELESAESMRGSYVPFSKNGAAIEFGSVTVNGRDSYAIVVTRDGADKCSWHVRAALKVGTKAADTPPSGALHELVVSFNCAAIDTPYSNERAYLGLIDPSKRLEYVTPRKAWSIDLSSMTFNDFPVSKTYCPAFFGE